MTSRALASLLKRRRESRTLFPFCCRRSEHTHTGAMVRTKADSVPGTYRKAVAASAPRKSLGASGSTNAQSGGAQSGTPAKNKYAGGNPVCPRPTPTWQKGIGDFFGGPSRKPEKENLYPASDDEEEAGGSGVGKAPRKSRPIIDEEEEDDE